MIPLVIIRICFVFLSTLLPISCSSTDYSYKFVYIFLFLSLVCVFLYFLYHLLNNQLQGTCPAAPTIDPNAVKVLENSTTNISGITRLRLEEIELNGPSQDVVNDIIIEILADLRCLSSPALLMDGAEVTTGPPSTSDCEETASILSREWNDPSLIGNGIFGIVTVLAFTKLMSFLIANDFVGPLVISTGDMVKRTSSFFIFVIAVIISFSSAMTFNYNIYSQGDIERCETHDATADCDRSYEYRK